MKLFRQHPTTAKVLDLRATAKGAPSSRRRYHWLVLVLVMVAVGVGGVLSGPYLLGHLPKPGSPKSDMARAVAAVGQLMILPTGEDPTYGTVTDKTKLNSQTFFKNAQNGDQVLIYAKAQISILYRPSIRKIVNVGPVVSGKSGSPYITSRIAVLNGTSNADALNLMVQRITIAFPNATIVAKAPASRDYPTSIVADLTAKNQPLAEQVADSLQIQGGKLPLGEPAPDADLLIIIGADFK